MELTKLIAKFSTVLSVGISDVATSMQLESNMTRDQLPLPAGLYAFVLDRGLDTEEFVIADVDEHGEADLLKRGISYIDGSTEVGGNVFPHRKGATIEITAHPVLTDLVTKFEDFYNTYDGKWSGAVEDYASLPQGQSDGEVRVTLDDSKIYVWSDAGQEWKLAGAGGGAGTVYRTDKTGDEAEGNDHKTFTMNSGSFPDAKYLQVYLNGVLQELGTDYQLAGQNGIEFDEEVLDEDKITLLVVSVDIVNPAWSQVNADILPDTDNAYDIGSEEKQFKEIKAHKYEGRGVINADDTTEYPAEIIAGRQIVLQDISDLCYYQNETGFCLSFDSELYEIRIVFDDINTWVEDLEQAIKDETGENDWRVNLTNNTVKITASKVDKDGATIDILSPSDENVVDISGRGEHAYLGFGEGQTQVGEVNNAYRVVKFNSQGSFDASLFELIPTPAFQDRYTTTSTSYSDVIRFTSEGLNGSVILSGKLQAGSKRTYIQIRVNEDVVYEDDVLSDKKNFSKLIALKSGDVVTVSLKGEERGYDYSITNFSVSYAIVPKGIKGLASI